MVRMLLAALSLALLLGCGRKDNLDRASVEGKVTLDGVAVERGSITFIPTVGTNGPTAGGTVERGRYSIAAADGPVAGRYCVEIYSPRNTGKKIQVPMAAPGTMTDEIVDALPARYNLKSTLEKDIKAGHNEIDFDLTSAVTPNAGRPR